MTKVTNTLNYISRFAEPFRLKINTDKTKVLTTDGSPANMYFEGIQIDQVQNFKYLGSLVQEKKIAVVAEVQCRIGQATAVFTSLKWCLWKKANITIATKMRLFWTRIIPILLYGSETWTPLKKEINKLEVLQMRCLGQILGVTWLDRLLNETVRWQCGDQPTIEEAIQKIHLQ